MGASLRVKILISVGIIIFFVLGTSTFVHIREVREDLLEATTLRAEALSQTIVSRVEEDFRDIADVESMLSVLSLQCYRLYNLHKEHNITHFSVINVAGNIVAHNDRARWDTPVEYPLILEYLRKAQPQQTLALVEDGYHALLPLFSVQDEYLGVVDVGFSKEIVDGKIRKVVRNSLLLLVLYLVLAFFAVSFLLRLIMTKPIKQLVDAGQQLAKGNLVQIPQHPKRQDEIAILGKVFNRISEYIQTVAEVAYRISTGVLDDQVHIRSSHDVLGNAVHDMLEYLHDISSLMKNIAEGNLRETGRVRSAADAFGQVIREMTEGVRSMVVRIRTSAEQMASTGTTIATLATHDIKIVQDVTTSVEGMVSTMNEMGASVEEVSSNMDVLSASVEQTSASVSQMTASIGHIASNTTTLRHQTHQTIESLAETVQALEQIVENIDVSKQLSQATNQDALDGQQAVEQVMTSMETIHQTVTTAVEVITRFSKRSQDIDSILDVIRNITEQTSLLALNASIIAAQAGVHGRGFAVVADEIKSLANGVGASTKDIAAIVQGLKQDTNSVVQTIHEGAADVEQGREHTQHARQALEKIIHSANRSSSVVAEIAGTLHDLRLTSYQVSEAMQKVNGMTNDITASTNEQKITTEQINQSTTHVNEMAAQIQLAMNEQLKGVHQVLDATAEVTTLIIQNQESSHHIMHTSDELSSQAELLLQEVDRFKLSVE